jgi:hypothetical protein
MQQLQSHGAFFGLFASQPYLALVYLSLYHEQLVTEFKISDAAVNVTLAFCMGKDLESLMNSSLGQPMAQIFLNSLGQKGTLVMWLFIILVQYMMGSSMVFFFYSFRSSIQGSR